MGDTVENIHKEHKRKILEGIKNNKKAVVYTEFFKIIKLEEAKWIFFYLEDFFKNNNTNKSITKNIFVRDPSFLELWENNKNKNDKKS